MFQEGNLLQLHVLETSEAIFRLQEFDGEFGTLAS